MNEEVLSTQTVLIISISVIGLMGIVFLIINKLVKKPDYFYYTQDKLYGAIWKWYWKKDQITDLWCHCPSCDENLVYENDDILNKTYFLCPTCDKEVGAIGGGDNNNALSIVEREIKRKVRLNEFIKTP